MHSVLTCIRRVKIVELKMKLVLAFVTLACVCFCFCRGGIQAANQVR